MIGVLEKIAGQCDGVRCDMAMLVLPDVFERTWKTPSKPGRRPSIGCAPKHLTSALWPRPIRDLEWALQQQGFDYAYDKRLYDRLRDRHARPVREHFLAGIDFQNRLARFLENHDEPRAAATFPPGIHEAAAAITFLSPGLTFFHQEEFGKTWQLEDRLGPATYDRAGDELKSQRLFLNLPPWKAHVFSMRT